MELTTDILNDFRKGKLETFYKEAYASLLTYAMRILGDDMCFLAEDCVQDCIYSCYQKRSNIQSPVQLKALLYTSVHNACISLLRKQQSRTNYLSQMDEGKEADMTQSIIEQEELDAIYRTIDSLPPRLKRIFNLSFEQGMKNEEIAQLLNLSVSGVKKQKRDLIEAVRQTLSRKGSKLLSMLICYA